MAMHAHDDAALKIRNDRACAGGKQPGLVYLRQRVDAVQLFFFNVHPEKLLSFFMPHGAFAQETGCLVEKRSLHVVMIGMND
jgi:hypothetical protein